MRAGTPRRLQRGQLLGQYDVEELLPTLHNLEIRDERSLEHWPAEHGAVGDATREHFGDNVELVDLAG